MRLQTKNQEKQPSKSTKVSRTQIGTEAEVIVMDAAKQREKMARELEAALEAFKDSFLELDRVYGGRVGFHLGKVKLIKVRGGTFVLRIKDSLNVRVEQWLVSPFPID